MAKKEDLCNWVVEALRASDGRASIEANSCTPRISMGEEASGSLRYGSLTMCPQQEKMWPQRGLMPWLPWESGN